MGASLPLHTRRTIRCDQAVTELRTPAAALRVASPGGMLRGTSRAESGLGRNDAHLSLHRLQGLNDAWPLAG